MFNIRGWEWLIILAIILIIWGPKRIPDIARALGKSVSEFRKGLKGVKEDLKQTSDEINKAGEEPENQHAAPLTDLNRTSSRAGEEPENKQSASS